MNSFQNNSNESILQGTQPSSVAVQPTGPVSRNQDSINDWHSKVGSFSDCLKDEESLWFGIWCCWIINSRTVHQFALEDSFKENCFFISAIIIFLILRFLSPILGISFAITAIVVLAWRRAKYRTSMRQKLSIPGTFADDLIIHAFCSCCAVCQEAREAKYAQYPRIDYCFGEPLLSREEAHDQAVNQTLNENPSLFGSCTSHIKTLSKTSKFIIFLCFIIALLTILIDLVSNSSANILVLLLIFTQPLAILYFVYWRERQQYAYLDYVVKTFAYGFW
jgi:Cys-rich protein (TIGR01571 family)